MTHRLKPLGIGVITLSTALSGLIWAGVAQAATAPVAGAPAKCIPNVGHSGLSAAVVAHPNQRLVDRTINATGCDIGIFVGPGVSHVKIQRVSVTGANFQGILALNTSFLVVRNSTIHGNGFHTTDPSAPPLPGSGVRSYVAQSFGISLFGVSRSVVAGNSVTDNGRGGIGLMDNGPFSPGTITQNPSAPLVPSADDTIVGNRTQANYNGCGVVVATQNVGGRLSNLVIAANTITGTGLSSNGPDIGGIVVAADPPNSSVSNVGVLGNQVVNSFEGGLIVNAEAPGATTRNVLLAGNTVNGNNVGHLEAPNTAGVIVFAAPAPGAANVNTVVSGNRITKQYYGVWSSGTSAPRVFGNYIKVTAGGEPIHHE